MALESGIETPQLFVLISFQFVFFPFPFPFALGSRHSCRRDALVQRQGHENQLAAYSSKLLEMKGKVDESREAQPIGTQDAKAARRQIPRPPPNTAP
jgi:hypothetical protein